MDVFGAKFHSFKQKLKDISSKSSSKSNSPSESMKKLQIDDKPEIYYPEFLKYGETFLKFDRFKDHEPYKVTIYYVNELKRLVLSGDFQGIDLESIEEIRYGGEGQDWMWRGLKKHQDLRKRTMTIIFKRHGNYVMYHFAADTESIAIKWCVGIRDYLIYRNKELSFEKLNGIINNEIWLKRTFDAADVNKSQGISETELKNALKTLNIKIGSKERKKLLMNYTFGRSKYLNYDEFVAFFNDLDDRNDVKAIFRDVNKHKEYMNFDTFRDFIINEQKEYFTNEQIQYLYCKYRSTENGLNYRDFVNYLTSNENMINSFDVLDDSYPLNDYFMASSHNTYLVSNQLSGGASVEAYVRCMQKGCRCIEVDCWDGPRGQAKATHGGTLTGNIIVKDILKAVSIYAFKKTPYPMLISLENHCSIPQQITLANDIREILKDNVILCPFNTNLDTLPPLSQLKFKVIIKVEFKLSFTKSLKTGKDAAIPMDEHTGNNGQYNYDDDDDTDDENLGEQEGGDNDEGAKEEDYDDQDSDEESKISKLKMSLLSITKNESSETGGDRNQNDDDDDDEQDYLDITEGYQTSDTYPVALELATLTVYCKSKPFKGINTALINAKHEYACCISEAASVDLYKHNTNKYVLLNQIQMTRVYPVGKRITSSNYNPVPHWLCGCQIVALNYQTFDRGTDVNDAMFQQTNYQGYVLKPYYLRSGAEYRPSKAWSRLTIEIISAQKLVKPKFKDEGDIIDTQVTVEVLADSVMKEGKGSSDMGDEIKNKYRSKVIRDNGFNPVFNEKVSYNFKNPELAFLRIKVHEYNLLKKQVIGSFTLPVKKLKSGYRHLTLRDRRGDPLPFSNIFIRVTHG
ncbi:PLC-like phosphodiesterase [Neocallimastix lanati (nom. inval.)]|uniref:Phosphoinositide phospholipase C n=1 Tax=Neocallimastix californiae TaxID=1754190 RepID=A0A1Y2DPE5_9FUNG|nr:PLC-like phosphodiesterase [Neocallimastix sp. JGI-2020a]ORY61130.1 PLC-like phosphodiesterase [Neocallimastix californiae]|eukprot:ORY61130.1 PLC-like phosphodiesterase [Neocallimastix californiae]